MTATTKKAAPKKKASTRKKSANRKRNLPANTQQKQLPQSQEQQVGNALMKSIESGTLQPEQLKMVLDAQERILDRQAKQEYFTAMALCQAEIGSVSKTQYNEHTESFYEDIESLNAVIKPVYTQHGFAVSFKSTAASQDGWIGMKATVSHRIGHYEEHTFELPIDDKGSSGNTNKTPVHGVASSRSYMRRYLLREIFNITTSEDRDDDGNAAGQDFITLDQVTILNDLIEETGADRAVFLRFCGIDELERMPAFRYDAALAALNKKKKDMSAGSGRVIDV